MDNIYVTNNNTMYKITLESTWEHNGITRNWVKYLKVNNFMQIFDFYELDKIKEIEECN
tara:strand:- start:807 stop:983 length:177 start_codon:yes stop_codon:yes gene_type:complete